MTTPRMMPGQEPYNADELRRLYAALGAAADADPGEQAEELAMARKRISKARKRISKDARGVYWMAGTNAISWECYRPSGTTLTINVEGNRAWIRTSDSRLLNVRRDGVEHRVHRALLKQQRGTPPETSQQEHEE
jgi:hypothetical protein